jgi:hypothetical protein
MDVSEGDKIMKSVFPTILFILSSVSILAAQDKACPQIEIIGPPVVVEPGETMTFTVRVVGGENIAYDWSVDKGEIFSGQGKSSVTVATDGLEDTTVTATALIEGLPDGCQKSFSDSGVVAGRICGSPFDQFGDIPNDDVRERLDAFLITLQNWPSSKGYIVSSGPADKIKKRENLVRSHGEFRNFGLERIILKDGGREESLRSVFWVVPDGAGLECLELEDETGDEGR